VPTKNLTWLQINALTLKMCEVRRFSFLKNKKHTTAIGWYKRSAGWILRCFFVGNVSLFFYYNLCFQDVAPHYAYALLGGRHFILF
jgi:hypothetical protein